MIRSMTVGFDCPAPSCSVPYGETTKAKPKPAAPRSWRCDYGFLHTYGERKPICPHCPKPKQPEVKVERKHENRGLASLVLLAISKGITGHEAVHAWLRTQYSQDVKLASVRLSTALMVKRKFLRPEGDWLALTDDGQGYLRALSTKATHDMPHSIRYASRFMQSGSVDAPGPSCEP